MTGPLHDKVNILLVDDQPAKLMSYEVILRELNENLLKATSGKEALEHLLKNEVAVILVDVCMPDLDGFQLAAMIREHPRFQKTAIIFISAIHLSDVDCMRGYEMGAVDYVPVPVIAEVLRAKVKVFAELYRKTRQLERLNAELEERVASRTEELATSTARLLQSEQRRTLALAAGNMGSWDWDRTTGDCLWDEGQYRIFGVDPNTFVVNPESIRSLIHADDWEPLRAVASKALVDGQPFQTEFRVQRPNGDVRWCIGSAAASVNGANDIVRISGVTVDITERKEAEERQALLAREVDHRAKNALALVQSIVRLTRAKSVDAYVAAVEGRIKALSRVHTVLSHSRWQGADLTGLVEEELAPYRTSEPDKVIAYGPHVLLQPAAAQTLALALHELVTNAAKYGALSSVTGRVQLTWELRPGSLVVHWTETGGPPAQKPAAPGFGTRIITASIERQLCGKTLFDWRADGLRCELTVPRNEQTEQQPEPVGGSRRDKDNGAESKLVVAGSRIMVVEDEALVAMIVSDALVDLGYSVVGPFSRAADAVAAIRNEEVDAAILDINLGGELVYPLAQQLADHKVPFMFITGYGAESIDGRFADIPVLPKPIERPMLQRILVRSNVVPIELQSGARAAVR